jgi:hypothetical protein
MTSLKLLFIACLIFDFSLCVNEANELINVFSPTGSVSMNCHNYVGELTIKGVWNNYNVPRNVSFPLNLTDGHNLDCSYTSQDPNIITCHLDHIKFHLEFLDQYMDAYQQFLIKGFSGYNFNCLSSYIYSDLLLLFIIIFILFN